jgi:hypothetical protein
VARLRLRWLMSALRMAQVAIPAAFAAWLRRGVIGALSPYKDAPAAHRAASITSAESITSVTRLPGRTIEQPSSRMSIGVRRISWVAWPSGSLVELTPDAICVDLRLSSPSALHNHSWPAHLEGLPRPRLCSRLHDLAFDGRYEHREFVNYWQQRWTVQRVRRGGVRMSDRVHRQPIARTTWTDASTATAQQLIKHSSRVCTTNS